METDKTKMTIRLPKDYLCWITKIEIDNGDVMAMDTDTITEEFMITTYWSYLEARKIRYQYKKVYKAFKSGGPLPVV